MLTWCPACIVPPDLDLVICLPIIKLPVIVNYRSSIFHYRSIFHPRALTPPLSILDFLSSIVHHFLHYRSAINCRLRNWYTVGKCWRCRHTYSEVGIDHTLRQIPQSDPCLSGKPCMLTLYVVVKTVRLKKIGGVLVRLFLCWKRVQWFRTVRTIATSTVRCLY